MRAALMLQPAGMHETIHAMNGLVDVWSGLRVRRCHAAAGRHG